jgi:hypothetical protein
VSDLQDLIHTNAQNAYLIGVRSERQRIIGMLESFIAECGEQCEYCIAQEDVIETIRELD